MPKRTTLTSVRPSGDELLLPAGLSRPFRFKGTGGIADDLARIAPTWPMERGSGCVSAAPCVRVSRRGAGFALVSAWLDRPARGLTRMEALSNLSVDLAQGFLAADPERIALHCGAVEIGGRLVVLTGPNRAGKSTLVAALAARHAPVFCDDILPLEARPSGLEGVALGIAPRLRLPLPVQAGAALRALAAAAPVRDGRYGYLPPEAVAPHGTRAPVGSILLLDRREVGPARFEPAGRAEALRMLLLRNVTEDREPAPLLARLEALIASAAVRRLIYSDVEEAAALVAETRLEAPAPLSAASPEVASHAAARDIDGELFLCDSAGRAVLHLDPIGAAVLRLCEAGLGAAEAAALLAEAFPDTPRARIEADVAALVADLAEAGFVAAGRVEATAAPR